LFDAIAPRVAPASSQPSSDKSFQACLAATPDATTTSAAPPANPSGVEAPASPKTGESPWPEPTQAADIHKPASSDAHNKPRKAAKSDDAKKPHTDTSEHAVKPTSESQANEERELEVAVVEEAESEPEGKEVRGDSEGESDPTAVAIVPQLELTAPSKAVKASKVSAKPSAAVETAAKSEDTKLPNARQPGGAKASHETTAAPANAVSGVASHEESPSTNYEIVAQHDTTAKTEIAESRAAVAPTDATPSVEGLVAARPETAGTEPTSDKAHPAAVDPGFSQVADIATDGKAQAAKASGEIAPTPKRQAPAHEGKVETQVAQADSTVAATTPKASDAATSEDKDSESEEHKPAADEKASPSTLHAEAKASLTQDNPKPNEVSPSVTADAPAATVTNDANAGRDSGQANSTPTNIAPPTATTALPKPPSTLLHVRHAAHADTSVGDIDPARFLHRVAKAFESARDRDTEVRLRLHPAELGSLSIEVKVEESALTARVQAETPEAKQALIENLPVLRERLAEQGIRIDQFDVDLMDHSDRQQQFLEERADRQGAARTSGRSVKTPLQSGPNATPSAGSSVSGKSAGLNVVI
jgi:flagellar hook-length control protein FliK